MTDAVLERFLTTQEVAALLRVPVATVYEWRRQGTGPRAHRVGRHLRYERDAFEDWLATQADDVGRATA